MRLEALLPLALLALAACDQKPAAKASRFVVVEPLPADGELTAVLARESAAATAKGHKPVAYVYATWCPPCKGINKHLHDPLMEDALASTHLIKLDFDQWKEADLDAAGLHVTGVPWLFRLDASGKPTGKTITSDVWGEDIPANMAPPLKQFMAN
jgi:thiol:disulfide interchange protein